VPGAAPGDVRGDLHGADLVAVALVIITTIGIQVAGTASGLAAHAAHPWDRVDQWQQLGDVVAVTAGSDRGQRDPVGLDDDVVLAAGPARSTGDGPMAGPPFIART
jgi:hypothetical protein